MPTYVIAGSKGRCISNMTNITLLYPYQLCLRGTLAQTLAKTLESNYFGGKIFGKTVMLENVPLNESASEKVDGLRIVFQGGSI